MEHQQLPAVRWRKLPAELRVMTYEWTWVSRRITCRFNNTQSPYCTVEHCAPPVTMLLNQEAQAETLKKYRELPKPTSDEVDVYHGGRVYFYGDIDIFHVESAHFGLGSVAASFVPDVPRLFPTDTVVGYDSVLQHIHLTEDFPIRLQDAGQGNLALGGLIIDAIRGRFPAFKTMDFWSPLRPGYPSVRYRLCRRNKETEKHLARVVQWPRYVRY